VLALARRPIVPLLLVVGACAPKHITWVHREHTDPVRLEQAQFECLKESRYSSRDVSVTKTGANAGTNMKVDERLFQACMRAGGYVPAPPDPDAPARGEWLGKWLRAPAPQGTVILEATGGIGGSFGTDVRALVAIPAYETGQEVATDIVRRAQVNTFSPMGQGSLGAWVPVSNRVEVGGVVGLRPSASWGPEVECYGPNSNGCTEDGWRNVSTGLVAAGVGWRPPGTTRLLLSAGLGAERAPRVAGLSGGTLVYDEESSESRTVRYTVEDEPGRILPFVRFGIGFDLVHPKPLGLGVRCSVEQLLGNGVLSGSAPTGADWAGSPTTTIGNCGLSVRLDPRVRD
jgi:hypothetical protein